MSVCLSFRVGVSCVCVCVCVCACAVLRLMNETTAVALTYGILRQLPKEDTLVAFVDVGDSQTQVSVVRFRPGKLKVLAAVGDPNTGGRDLDWLLGLYFAKDIKEKYKLDVLSNRKATYKLLKECVRVKKVSHVGGQAVSQARVQRKRRGSQQCVCVISVLCVNAWSHRLVRVPRPPCFSLSLCLSVSPFPSLCLSVSPFPSLT